MAPPKVSILWLNYNSRHILDLVLESLDAVAHLNYPPDRYELVVVDNGSTDGSFEVIKSHLDKLSIRKKVVKLSYNLGFCGGNNVALRLVDPESKYIVLLNNDAVPFENSLRDLVDYAEKCPNVGAVGGVVLQYKKPIIDTAGVYIDELFLVYPVGGGEPYPWIISHPYYVTYVSGDYALYRRDAIRKCLGDRLFYEEMFAYGDDSILGLQLWNCGFSSLTIPHLVSYHRRSATFRKVHAFGWYLNLRNKIATSYLSNSRYTPLLLLFTLKGLRRTEVSRIHARIYYDSFTISRKLKSRVKLDIYRAPILRPGPLVYMLRVMTARRLFSPVERKLVMEALQKYKAERCN